MARAEEARQLQQFDIQRQQMEQEQKSQRQREAFERKKLSQQAIQIKDNFAREASSLTQRYEREKETLSFGKQAAMTEQLGFLTRMNTDKYIEQLRLEGTKYRLDNARNFKEQAIMAAFSEELELFRSDLTFRRGLLEDQRRFNAEHAIYDLEAAIRMAMIDTKEAQQRTIYQAAGGIFSGGLQAVGIAEDAAMQMTTPTTTGSPAATREGLSQGSSAPQQGIRPW
jgi:hypothetical protein